MGRCSTSWPARVASRALVIGYGNELRADDGAGFALVERLAADPPPSRRPIDYLARRQLTPELALDVSRADRLVLVDATTELPAGEIDVHRLEADARVDAAPSSHHMTPQLLIGLATELYGATPEAWLVSIGAASLELGEGISVAVGATLERATTTILELADA
jgi:hydrogenase maturation protease